jgi:hypothetical protein
MSFSCGKDAGFIMKVILDAPPNDLLCLIIFSTISSESPTSNAPSGPRWASKAVRVTLCHPRSFPSSVIVRAILGKKII